MNEYIINEWMQNVSINEPLNQSINQSSIYHSTNEWINYL